MYASYIMCHRMIMCDIVCPCMTLYVPRAGFRSGLLCYPAKCMLDRNVMCDMYDSYGAPGIAECMGRMRRSSCSAMIDLVFRNRYFFHPSRVGSQVIMLKYSPWNGHYQFPFRGKHDASTDLGMYIYYRVIPLEDYLYYNIRV